MSGRVGNFCAMECSAEKMGFCDCCGGSMVKNAPPLVNFSPEAGCERPMIRSLSPEWREQSADGHGGKLSWWGWVWEERTWSGMVLAPRRDLHKKLTIACWNNSGV